MKEKVVDSSKKLSEILTSEYVKTFIMQIFYFALGLLVSRGIILENYAPFGAALIAAMPYSNIWAGLVGEILGYILPSSINASMRYIAAALSVAAIRWTLNDLKKIKIHPLYAPLIAALPILATGIAVGTVDGFTSKTIITIITESMLAAVSAYFFSYTKKLASGSKGITALDQQELVCISMSICIIILSLSGVNPAGISLGRVIAVLFILCCSNEAGIAGGCISGIAFGIIFSLSSYKLFYISGAYAFAGMMSGLFSKLGKVGTAAAFILANAIISLQTGNLTMVMVGLYEVMAASLIFIIIPKKITAKLAEVFSASTEKVGIGELRRAVLMRLNYVSQALASVSDSVESVSEKLNKVTTSNIEGVYEKAFDNTCNNCGLRVFCWDKDYDNTLSYFNNTTDFLKRNGYVAEESFSKEFPSRCCKSSDMITSINKYYDEFLVRESAYRRIGELREILAEQFSGMSDMLKDISVEFQECEQFDTNIADKINFALKSSGITPIEVSCRVNRFGRMSVEIEALGIEDKKINRFDLIKDVSKACDRVMDTPCISLLQNRCRIQISERAKFSVQFGSTQHICNNGKLCGDNYSYFDDGMGRVIVVISDGMGTGGRAAVDGAMASGIMSKLIQAGVGFDCALKVVNSALLVKSGEESLATLDIGCIDLFTGEATFLKAGAPPTFVKKGEEIICLDKASLPAGILNNIRFSKASVKLKEDDLILMVSDGALIDKEDWIKKELEEFKGNKNAQDLSDYIVNEAAKFRKDTHDDDITAIAIKLMEK